MQPSDVGRTLLILVGIGFPVYLLWTGRARAYLSLATGG
jgi:hypothetical protein